MRNGNNCRKLSTKQTFQINAHPIGMGSKTQKQKRGGSLHLTTHQLHIANSCLYTKAGGLPKCTCGKIITVKPFLLECRKLTPIRKRYLQAGKPHRTLSTKELQNYTF